MMMQAACPPERLIATYKITVHCPFLYSVVEGPTKLLYSTSNQFILDCLRIDCNALTFLYGRSKHKSFTCLSCNLEALGVQYIFFLN